MNQDGPPNDPLDEVVVRYLDDGAQRQNWLVAWLAEHPDRAEDLARFLAASRAVESWVEPVRDLFDEDSGPTVAYAPGRDSGEIRVPGYEIGSELGRGGMGIVHAAIQVPAGRTVALKTIRTGEFASPREVALFRLEATTAALLDHPHIVPVYDVGERDGVLYFSMKRFATSLARRIQAGPSLDPVRAAQLVAIIARAVQYAHEQGVIHRDLKPANILLDDQGDPHVGDFGLARRRDAVHGQSTTGTILGTPEYMAPEQARGERHLTEAVDVYGLGGILYACLTGRPPFQGGNVLETMQRVQYDPVRKPRDTRHDVPTDLELICLRCLAKDPADRYPSAQAVAEDLECFLAGKALGDQPSARHRLWKVLTRPPHVTGLVTMPAFYWSIGLGSARHLGVFLLAWYGAAVVWVWPLFLVWIGTTLGVLWRSHLTSPRALVTRAEFHSMTFGIGAMAAQLALFAQAALALPSPLDSPTLLLLPGLYPGLAVIGGLTLFAHGVTHWGALYLAGLGYMLLAFPLGLLPAWSPLLLAVSELVLAVVLGRAMAHQVAQARAVAVLLQENP
jgi:serine/threonine-protein kinase